MRKPKTEPETHYERFTRMLQHIVSVPKSEIEKREAEWKKGRAKIRKAKTHSVK